MKALTHYRTLELVLAIPYHLFKAKEVVALPACFFC
jgi:hypothetical protein